MDILCMVKSIEGEIINLRRILHQNPELSFREFDTANLVENYLQKLNNIKVLRIGQTGVVGILEGKLSFPKKTLALRVDIDAIPNQERTNLPFSSKKEGIMHGCGHDIHTSILLGVAKILSNLVNNFSGIIKFIFQPGEEKLTGAQKLIEQGVLLNPKIDSIIGFHCWPEIPVGTIGTKRGTIMASADSLNMKIIGKSGHLAHPDKYIDPILISAHIIVALQTIISREISPVEAAVISFGQINGGTNSNVSPNEVLLSGTIRTINSETRKSMPERITRISENIAKGFRGEIKVEYVSGCGLVNSDGKLLSLFEKVTKKTIGKDKLIHLENPSMGSEDFSYYLEQVPGLYFRLGTKKPGISFQPLHSSYFNADEKSILTGISVLINMVFEYFS